MEGEALHFTVSEQETIKYVIWGLLLIPGLFLLRFIIFLIMPKFVLKKFWRKKHGYKNLADKKEKKFYED